MARSFITSLSEYAKPDSQTGWWKKKKSPPVAVTFAVAVFLPLVNSITPSQLKQSFTSPSLLSSLFSFIMEFCWNDIFKLLISVFLSFSFQFSSGDIYTEIYENSCLSDFQRIAALRPLSVWLVSCKRHRHTKATIAHIKNAVNLILFFVLPRKTFI